MEDIIEIRCKNNNKIFNFNSGISLFNMLSEINPKTNYFPTGARVNNVMQGLGYRVYSNKDVEYVDISSMSGLRAYIRTLFFILCKAVNDTFPNGKIIIDIPVSNGYYCNLHIGRKINEEDAALLKNKMQEIIQAEIPIKRFEKPTEEVIKMFEERGSVSKVKLLSTTNEPYSVYYMLDGYADYYFGTMLTNTKFVDSFDLVSYFDGMLLRIPDKNNPDVLGEMIKQDKMFNIFKEHHSWQNIIGVGTVGDFNEAITKGKATNIINISEALQEKKIAKIAENIAQKPNIKLILIAGPSSSGKTTTCKRLAIQLLCNGIKPISISLDDYFVNRENTPKDETGEYDYESVYSLNIELLNSHLKSLFNGEEIELPKYDFITGKSVSSGTKLKLNDREVLVLEGIHALNPELTKQIDNNLKYKIYASALTTILLDTHNYIPTTDNRLLRRMIRDYKYRGVSAQETIKRWGSVRRGEDKWIFPFQENADEMFNTAMLYELSVIKQQALPLLEMVPPNSVEYAEAVRLTSLLKMFYAIPNKQIPPTSLLREFLGGSSFKY